MEIALIIGSITVVLFLLGWIGLHVKPQSFSMPALPKAEQKNVPLPDGLPASVKRFYRTLYGEQMPVIGTVVLTGRGRIRPFGIWLPARFVMLHKTGRDYRHYFEATFFPSAIPQSQRRIVDGESFFESPIGTYYDDPNINQGANLALWAEGGWFPSIWLTDRRVRWEAVDENTALLLVPFEDEVETFIVRFNPQTGLVDLMEVMRFKKPTDKQKTLWITSSSKGGSLSYATWLDDGKPWAEISLEKVVFNVNVSEYIRVRGQ